jgi:hypothetical protein
VISGTQQLEWHPAIAETVGSEVHLPPSPQIVAALGTALSG